MIHQPWLHHFMSSSNMDNMYTATCSTALEFYKCENMKPRVGVDNASDQKSFLFPKLYLNDRNRAGSGRGGGSKPPPGNKMTIYEYQPETAGSMNISQRINTSSNITMPPFLLPPKFCSISPSRSSVCYVGGQVPQASAGAVRLPFYAQNTVTTITTPTVPTLPLLPFSKLDDDQAASISQHKRPPLVSSTRNVQKKYPENEIFHRNHFKNDTVGSKGWVADDSVELLYTQMYASRADALTTSSSTTNRQLQQSNHSRTAFGGGSSLNKPAHYGTEQVRASELVRRESCLPKAPPVDDIRGPAGVATSSRTPHTHCEYRGVLESQNVRNRKGSQLEITPADVTAIIGEDAFLRLRGEMIKHQKQFVEQVFQLHRLIAVQRLIARSRRALIEDKYKLEKPSSSRAMNPKEAQKGHCVEKQDDATRLTSSSGYASKMFYLPPQMKDPFKVPRPNQETPAGNPKPALTSGINSPWTYPPRGTANHWLVPVMSPSEGIIYKPYPIPCAPSPAGFISPAQTHPLPFQQSGIGPSTDVVPFCFPPYVTSSLPSASAFEHHPNAALTRSSFRSSWNFSTLGSGTVSRQAETTQQAKYGGDSTASSSPPYRTRGSILPLFPEEPTAIAMLPSADSK